MKQPRILTNAEIRDALSRSRKKRCGIVEAAVMEADEQGFTAVPWPGENLPEIDGGWMLQASASFVRPAAQHFKREDAARSDGPDDLFVELLAEPTEHAEVFIDASADPQRGRVKRIEAEPGERVSLVVKGRVVVVGSPTRPMLAHVSTVGTIVLNFVDIVPTDPDRSKHYRTEDGRRVAGLFGHAVERSIAGGRGQDIPALLLRYLAEREQPSGLVGGSIMVLPSPSQYMLPGVPSVGEWKRRRRKGKSSPMPSVEEVVETIRARRTVVAVKVSLDDESMRLAEASFRKRPKDRSASVQMLLKWSAEAKDSDSMQAAVEDALSRFDTDYILTFDAVTAMLAQARLKGVGAALDDALEREVVEWRFGSTDSASKAQRERVARHFATMREIVVEVVPTNPSNTKVFRGRIVVPIGEMIDRHDPAKPLRVGEVVTLNPMLYPDIERGRGLFIDARYFRFDPYRDDWKMRLYRCLAARWSQSSVNLAKRGDWTLSLKLVDILDMAGVAWRVDTVTRGRSQAEQRREVERTLVELERDGFIGPWRIDGEAMSPLSMLHVEVAPNLRKGIVDRRRTLHLKASQGALKTKSV